MKKYDYTEYEIINYVNNLKTSDNFLKELETNTELQKKVTSLKNDLFLMENIEDSNIFKELKRKSIINIKNGFADYLLYFSIAAPLNARGDEINNTYIYKNIEIKKNNDEYYINIRNIKNWCIIEYNGEKIVNITGEKDIYSANLKNGFYNIKADDYECDINIE